MAALTGGMAVAAAAVFGGWEWALLCSIVLLALWRADFQAASVLASVAVSMLWLALYVWTGDRRLFFPYSMQLAVQMSCLLRGRVERAAAAGGGGIIAVFLAIRIAQSATAGVLFVEFLVAVLAMAISLPVYARSSNSRKSRIFAGALGSALAFAGLGL